MISVESKEITSSVRNICREFWNHISPSFKGVDIQGILLAGAHAKGTVNKDSDIDLQIYYSYHLKDLIKLHQPSINIKDSQKLEIKDGSGVAYYLYDNKEFELNFVPIKTTTGTRKELFSNLYSQKIDYFYKILNGIPLYDPEYSIWFDELLGYLINDFHLNKDSVFGYFHGYMKSQLQRHRRRSDHKKRLTESLAKNDCTPIVKLTIDGLWMCLNGINLLENQELGRDFFNLCFEKYDDLWELEELNFLMSCHQHKCDIKRLEVKPDRWIYYAMDMRDAIFEKLDRQIKIALNESSIPDFTKSMRRENEKKLNNLLFSLYELDIIK